MSETVDKIIRGAGAVPSVDRERRTLTDGTFCCDCGAHFPVGDDGEFVWIDAPDEKVGT